MERTMTYGPIDFLVLEFKTANLKGEILPALLELVENQTIRVIDLVIIQKNENGIHQALEMNQVGPDLLGVFDPLKVEVSGMIQIEDIQRIAEEMECGTNVAALMFENLWAIKFKDAVLNANGKLLEQVRIPHEDVEESLAIFASAEQPA
jgi:hypothetical protein